MSPSSSSSLSSVRVLLIERVRVSLKLEFDFSSPIGSRLVRTMSTRRRSLGKGKGRKGEMSTGLMVGYLVGWCGEGYWCGGGGEFWGRGRLVESEVVRNILSYFRLPELDLVVGVSGRGERVIVSWNPSWIHQNIEEDLFRSIP